MKTTKTEKVLQHLINHGSITSMEAIMNYKVTRLAAVIFCLKKKGFDIETVIERGADGPFARYIYMGVSNG